MIISIAQTYFAKFKPVLGKTKISELHDNGVNYHEVKEVHGLVGNAYYLVEDGILVTMLEWKVDSSD